MQALRLNKDIPTPTIETIPIPTVGPHDVLIAVKSSGIQTGVFRLAATGQLRNLPATPGSEIAGIVSSVGHDVSNIKPGARVRVHTVLSCRSCQYCLSDADHMCAECGLMGMQDFGRGARGVPLFERYRDGGLAEYVRAPEWLVDELPANVSFDVGCKVHEFAIALRTLKEADLKPGAKIIVTAPTGAMGSSILKLAHMMQIGYIVLVGRSRQRLEAVQRLSGVRTDIVALEDLEESWTESYGLAKRLTALLPEGADAFIDLTPSGTGLWQGVKALRVGGSLVHLGANSAVLPLPMVAIMVNCWKIVGTKCSSRNDALTILKWLAEDQIKDAEQLITHKWSFDQIREAISQMEARSLPIWMAVINL